MNNKNINKNKNINNNDDDDGELRGQLDASLEAVTMKQQQRNIRDHYHRKREIIALATFRAKEITKGKI